MNAKINMATFTEEERKKKVGFMGYFNRVMAELSIIADEKKKQKINELKNKGLFHIPILELEELLKEAHGYLGVKPKTEKMEEIEKARKVLWEFFQKRHDISLLDSELEEIIQEVVKYLDVTKSEE